MTKYFVAIGINDYPGEGSDLAGCVNDAVDWSELLLSRGYVGQKLLDEQATRANVWETLASYVDELRYRDTLVVCYSGHGSWVPDIGGDEGDDRDECLVLHDYQDNGYLLDDELYDIFDRRAYGTRIIFFSDSCHSGSVHRFANTTRVDSNHELSKRARFMPPELFLRGNELERAYRIEENTGVSKSRSGAALISGCGDWEYSYDAWFNGRANGAFTRTAIDRLNQYSPADLYNWWYRIRTILPNRDYPQSPQLSMTSHQKRWMI